MGEKECGARKHQSAMMQWSLDLKDHQSGFRHEIASVEYIGIRRLRYAMVKGQCNEVWTVDLGENERWRWNRDFASAGKKGRGEKRNLDFRRTDAPME